jgi:hypothetical protein
MSFPNRTFEVYSFRFKHNSKAELLHVAFFRIWTCFEQSRAWYCKCKKKHLGSSMMTKHSWTKQNERRSSRWNGNHGWTCAVNILINWTELNTIYHSWIKENEKRTRLKFRIISEQAHILLSWSLMKWTKLNETEQNVWTSRTRQAEQNKQK